VKGWRREENIHDSHAIRRAEERNPRKNNRILKATQKKKKIFRTAVGKTIAVRELLPGKEKKFFPKKVGKDVTIGTRRTPEKEY